MSTFFGPGREVHAVFPSGVSELEQRNIGTDAWERVECCDFDRIKLTDTQSHVVNFWYAMATLKLLFENSYQ